MREFLFAVAMTAVGAVIGSAYGGSLVTSALPWFYWPSVVGVAIIGTVCLVLWAGLGWREDRFHKSPALDLIFDGPGTPCVMNFMAQGEAVVAGTPPALVPTVRPTAGLADGQMLPARCVRLRVMNRRRRRLDEVRVRVAGARNLDGESVEVPAQWLHLMNDDSAAGQASIPPMELDPGKSTYLDVAMHARGQRVWTLYFAVEHLRSRSYSGVLVLDIIAVAKDQATGRRAPDCHRSFAVGLDSDSRLSIFDQPSISPAISSQVQT